MQTLDSNIRQNECVEMILNISREIVSRRDIQSILHSCYIQINSILDAPLLAIGIFNPLTKNIDLYGKNSITPPILTGSISIENTKIWSVRCFTKNEEIIINNRQETDNMFFSKVLFSDEDCLRKSFLFLPVISRHKKIGILTIQSFLENAYSNTHINTVRSIAQFIGIAIENMQYSNQIKEQQLEMKSLIDNMETIIETRTMEIQKQKNELHLKSSLLKKINTELEILSIVAKKTENAIMIMDSEGNIIWINDFFTKIYGYDLSSFIETRGSNIRETSFNADIDKFLHTCISKKKAVYYEAKNIKQNGEEIWTHTSLTPILDSEGSIKNLVTIDSDISSVKNAELAVYQKSQEILHSIEYAEKIQRAVFPSIESINDILKENFILWKPLNIVSGDFYWIKQRNNTIFIVLSDCTGHGVPGALLSMLGCSLLEELLQGYKNENAAELLCMFNSLFEQRFRHKVMGSEVFDGMDVGLCIINTDTNILHFSGANQDLIYFDKSILTHIRGNRISIGDTGRTCSKDFINNQIILNDNMLFFLFTDGYTSQFGGFDKKKYMKKNLVSFLSTIIDFPIKTQETMLLKELSRWMGEDNDQTDDILIIGFKSIFSNNIDIK